MLFRSTHVKEGDVLTASTHVATCDLDALAEAGKDNAMVVVVTNMDKVQEFELTASGEVTAQSVIGTVLHK